MYRINKSKLYKPFSNDIENPRVFFFLKKILLKDASFLWMAAVYGIVISLLYLVLPISVQFLINSVSFTAMMQPIIVLTIILFILLTFWAILNAIQFYVTEIFQRKFFARMVSEVGLSLLKAKRTTFEEANQTEMVNRFFETISIQKSIPKFLTKTFAVIFQTIVGLVLVAFYHPLFLLFDIFILTTIFLIWKAYYRDALVNSFFESRKKYDIAGWLEDIAHGHVIFKSETGNDYAKFKINFLTKEYLERRKGHFKNLFSQVISLLALYVIASTALLFIGGFLVIKNQLTIGQLVASELIFSTILYGISQLGRDFENFYDLIASCEKLSQFQNIPSDEGDSGERIEENSWLINFNKCSQQISNQTYKFDVKLNQNKNYLIFGEDFSSKKLFIEMLLGFANPDFGSVEINGKDIRSLNKYNLRSQIELIDNSPLIEGRLREYLTLGKADIPENVIFEALRIVGLEDVITKSGDKLELRIIPSGWPFSETEKLLIKVARAIISNPKFIIITEIFDILSLKTRLTILNYLTKKTEASIVYFSNRYDSFKNFHHFIILEKNHFRTFSSLEELINFEQKNSPHDE